VKFFDPHIHMTSRTTADYEAMAQAGIRGIDRYAVGRYLAAVERRTYRAAGPIGGYAVGSLRDRPFGGRECSHRGAPARRCAAPRALVDRDVRNELRLLQGANQLSVFESESAFYSLYRIYLSIDGTIFSDSGPWTIVGTLPIGRPPAWPAFVS